MANEIPYLADRFAEARSRSSSERVADIAREINRAGFWEQTVEWRISTETTSRIEVEPDPRGRRWFRVSVRSESEHVCHAPTLERAVEFMELYERLIADIFYTVGWSSWADRGRPDPQPGETLP